MQESCIIYSPLTILKQILDKAKSYNYKITGCVTSQANPSITYIDKYFKNSKFECNLSCKRFYKICSHCTAAVDYLKLISFSKRRGKWKIDIIAGVAKTSKTGQKKTESTQQRY